MLPQKIDRYEIQAELGRGGMATVYRAFDPRFKREVAVKVLPREFLHDPAFRARFNREAETIAALEHAAIVPVYDFGEDEGQPFLVMRFMPGGSLAAKLKKGPLTLLESARILSRVATALDRAHSRGIIHRDLKPDNILFDADDEPYIADFGIVKIFVPDKESFTSTGGIVGTPAYTSPEQARGEKDIDGRSDIYALGVTLFQMLSGKLPYQAETPMSILVKHITEPVPRILTANPELPPDCETLIQKAMAKDRLERYATAGEMAAMLTTLAKSGGLPATTAAIAHTTPQQQPPVEQPAPSLAATIQIEATAKQPPRPASRVSKRLTGKAWVIIIGVIIGAIVIVSMLPGLISTLSSHPTPSAIETTAPATSMAEATQPPETTLLQPAPSSDDATTGALEPLLTIQASSAELRAVAFSPDGTKLASCGVDKTIRIWDTASGQALLSLAGHDNIVTSLAWSPDGGRLASGSDDQTIRVWDTSTGKPVLAPLTGHTHFILSVAWSPNGKWIASASWDQRLIVWDAGTGDPVLELDTGGEASSVSWSPDSASLAISSYDRILVLDSGSGEERQRFPGFWGSIAWSPDGQYLAAANQDYNIHVWQVDNWDNKWLLQGHTYTITALAWSPDSRQLVSTAYDVTVRVWDGIAGDQLSPSPIIPSPMGNAQTVDWSRDGKHLAAAGGEGIILIWDATHFGAGK